MKKVAILMLCAISIAAFADDNRSHGGAYGGAHRGYSRGFQGHADHSHGHVRRYAGGHDHGGHTDGGANRYGG